MIKVMMVIMIMMATAQDILARATIITILLAENGVGETSSLPQTLIHYHPRPGILSALAPFFNVALVFGIPLTTRNPLLALLRLLRRG